MRSLHVSLVAAGLLALSATTLSAQSSKVACKDGSQPKVGHFSCWGHGGLVTGAATPAKGSVTQAGKPAKKHPAAPKAKKTGSATHAKKAHAKKAHAKKAADKSDR